MPVRIPIRLLQTFPTTPTARLLEILEFQNRIPGWENGMQQTAFNIGMEIYHRPLSTNSDKQRVNTIFRKLAFNHGRTWTRNPPSSFYRNPNLNSNSNSNRVSNSPPHPNTKAKKYFQRWRNVGPVELVNLPENIHNRTDPIILHVFGHGQTAVRHQRKNVSGRVISTNYYLLPTIERYTGMKWRNIRRMHGNSIIQKVNALGKRIVPDPGSTFLATTHVPSPLTRYPMKRAHLSLVKFK